MHTKRSIPFHGDVERALDFVAMTLSGVGLRIVDRTPESLVMEGSGMGVSTKNPFSAVTEVRLTATDHELILEADLSGARRLERWISQLRWGLIIFFMLLFGPGMGLFFGVLFGAGFGVPFAPGWKWLAFVWPLCVLPLLPWVILGPLMAKRLAANAERLLQTLLENAAATAESTDA